MTFMFNDDNVHDVKELLEFLTTANAFGVKSKSSGRKRADWIRERLVKFKYYQLSRKEKGILRRYLCKMTGCSHRTIKYHITAYKKGKRIGISSKRNRFGTTYTASDMELLADTDNLHGRLNGGSTRKICEAMLKTGDARYNRLARISSSHIYNLRKKRMYTENSLTIQKTKSVERAIGERRKPEPKGIPGFIRVDTVHQGDKEGEKGVYHINLVDEVTQWEVIVAVETISEAFLLEVLGIALEMFPFVIRNFHSDNGSEFINYQVAGLLNKLLISQTKSRPRHSNDNGLVETKNGSIIRKHMGYLHIPQKFAPRINTFYKKYFIPYLNFHRPCAFPKKILLFKGKIKTIYPQEDYQTPLQKFLSLQHPDQYLNSQTSVEELKEQSSRKTPNEAAKEMQQAKKELLTLVVSFPSHLSAIL